MKQFRYFEDRFVETFTVKELIAKLSEYHEDMPVFGEWEGVAGMIDKDSFSVKNMHKGNLDDACECLLIDVESY